MDEADSGRQAVYAFIDAFNQQDHPALAASLNYPHIRLARGQFRTVESASEFAATSEKLETHLRAEGWAYTVVRELDVLHAAPDKVHMTLTIDRCSVDNSVYNTFNTLWIATLQDEHWGIQFRSSYL